MAKRRGNSEGSIYQLPDGTWCASVSLGYRNGKRWRKKVSGRTRRDVQVKLNELLQSARNGFNVAPKRQTVAHYLAVWLAECAKQTVRPATFTSYEKTVNHYLVPKIGRIELAKLTPQQVRHCVNELLESGLSPRTVQYARAILRRALNQAVKDGALPRNVVTLTDSPKVEKHEIQPFTPEQTRAFLDSVKGDRLEALFTVAVALGMRQGEILGLRWLDIDLDAGMLMVRHALQRIDGKSQLVEPKTRSSKRTIHLPGVAISALFTHRASQEQERLLAGSRWQDWGLVFTSNIGTPMESCNLNHRFQRIAKAAGLPKLRFHDLRHTAATLLLAQGVHPRLVMEILGHSQISLTMNTYSHVIPAMRDAVADKMDAILAPVATAMATTATRKTVQ